jgi:hypothetical protein
VSVSFSLFAAALAFFFFASSAVTYGASISYLPLVQSGTTVDYENITEASSTDPVPLFGAPLVSGDSIDFNPVLFNALSQFGGLADLTDGQLTFNVQAHAGQAIKNITFREGGITTVVGGGTDVTFTDVSAGGFLNILHVDGNPINVISVPINLSFSHQPNGTWKLGTDGVAFSLAWTGSQTLYLNSVLAANNVPFILGPTRLSIDLDNSLYAQSEAGTIAFIDKKDFGGLSITINVPEPASALLAMLAGLGLVALRPSVR